MFTFNVMSFTNTPMMSWSPYLQCWSASSRKCHAPGKVGQKFFSCYDVVPSSNMVLWRTLIYLLENISVKFKDNGGSVQDALQTLADSIVEFNDEAEVCAQLRMGRMEETGQAVKHAVDSTMDVVIGTSTKVTGTLQPDTQAPEVTS